MLAAERLLAALHRLKDIARRGDLLALGDLTDEITLALHALEQSGAEQDQLEEIAMRAADVGLMLEAVEKGLNAARQRLNEIRAVRSGEGTYGGDGRRRSLSKPRRDMRRV